MRIDNFTSRRAWPFSHSSMDHKRLAPDRAGHGPAPMPGRGGAFSVITLPSQLANGNETLKRLIFHAFTAPSL